MMSLLGRFVEAIEQCVTVLKRICMHVNPDINSFPHVHPVPLETEFSEVPETYILQNAFS